VTLRCSAGADCAWGLLSGLAPVLDPNGQVWLDRSSDGGATWEQSAVRETRWHNSSTCTTAWSTAGSNAVRACGLVITQGFKKQSKKNPDTHQGIVDTPTVFDISCTEWVAV
jgi:hypothetical protein